MRIIAPLLIALALIFSFSCSEKKVAQKKAVTEKEQPATESTMPMTNVKAGKIVYYTCPMEEHSQVHSPEPGKCPLCGMDLVAVEITTPDKAEFYGCTMPEHSAERYTEPGVCKECGMKLEPMRLVK